MTTLYKYYYTQTSVLNHVAWQRLLTLGVPRLSGPRTITGFESESDLLYEWWFTANLFVLAPSLLRLMSKVFFFCN
jgi:hypothetical protein